LRSELLRVPLDPDEELVAHLLELVRMQSNQLAIVMRRAHLYAGQRRAVEALLAAVPQAIAISALEPFDAPLAARARAVLCSYGDDECAIEALAEALSGRIVPRGTLPVRLTGHSA